MTVEKKEMSFGGITCQNGKVVSVNKGKWDESQGFEQDFEFHKKWLSACKRVLKKNGTLWVSGTYHSIYSCGFAMQLLGYHILNDISSHESYYNALKNFRKFILVSRFGGANA